MTIADQSTSAPAPDAIRETHGDWIVSFAVNDAGQKFCVIAQEHFNKQTRQRMLGVELRSNHGGTLILPFGLTLSKGVSLQVDEEEPFDTLPFRTALPVGCMVELDFDAGIIGKLKKGKSLRVNAVANDTGREIAFSISLRGFSAAFARMEAL